jgi:transposase-like protein
MRHKSGPHGTAEKHIKDICRATRKQYSAEEKIRIVLEGLRGEYSIAGLCRLDGIPNKVTLRQKAATTAKTALHPFVLPISGFS